ncbi:MarR family transcriptional regulator [Staphylococcus pasteuri]
MYEDYEKLDFVDLISERHSHLRGIVEDLTNQEITDSKLSSSEWYVIFRIYKKQLSFVELNQSVNLSRQAIHKVVNKLQDKEIAVIKDVEGNKKREKCTAHKIWRKML